MAPARKRSSFATTRAAASTQLTRPFEGVIPNMERRYRETDSNWVREELERYQNNRPCAIVVVSVCAKRRWRCKIGELHCGPGGADVDREAYDWCSAVPERLTQAEERDREGDFERKSASGWVSEQRRAEYLTLSRESARCRAVRASASGWRARSGRA